MPNEAAYRSIDHSRITVDPNSGHCAEDALFHVCFDPRPTLTGAIKAVGPFVAQGHCIADTTLMMQQATLAIEATLGGYVVWGEYYANPRNGDLVISVLREHMGFYPNLAMRASLFGGPSFDEEISKREWVVSKSLPRHRSNGLVTTAVRHAPDPEIIHPTDSIGQLELLKQIGKRDLGLRKLMISDQITSPNRLPKTMNGQ